MRRGRGNWSEVKKWGSEVRQGTSWSFFTSSPHIRIPVFPAAYHQRVIDTAFQQWVLRIGNSGTPCLCHERINQRPRRAKAPTT